MRKLIGLTCTFLIVCLVGGLALGAQNPPPQVRSTDKPFLWRIEGTVPSYLYGTIHVPDPRVLELPEVVRRAMDVSDVFNAEIPLDAGTQMGMLSKIMLPQGEDLRKIAGDEVFARLVGAITKALSIKLPPGAADILASTLAPMKPWAAMSQVELLEFLPDMMAGRQPLDAMLYGMATTAGKDVGGLETVDEQVGVFEAFTIEEQVRMLKASLDDLDKPRPGGVSPTRQLVNLYLAGDLGPLAGELNDQYPDDPALKKKMVARVIDDRNVSLSGRIAALCAKRPAKSYFFAVGALHYAGDTGILTQLTKKGFKITRLGPADAASIVRKPAA